MIVDDDEATRDAYAWCLRAAGWQVEDLTNGLDALAVAPIFAPDVIVMDLRLPYIDGIAAARRLKKDPRTAHIPVVACSAFVREHTLDLQGVGFEAVLQKPEDPEDLRERLEQIVAARRER